MTSSDIVVMSSHKNIILKMNQFFLIFLSGLFGSAIDSVLGALFQFSGKDLDTRLIVSEPGDGVM